MSHSGEHSDATRKRGRPPQLSIQEQKDRKNITTKKARGENRAAIVGLTEIAPTLKQLVESVSSDSVRQFQQSAPYIENAIVSFKEVAPDLLQLADSVRQGNQGELLQNVIQTTKEIQAPIMELREVVPLLQNEAQNLMQSNQELKASIDELNLNITSLKEVAPVSLEYNQNFMQTSAGIALGEQQINDIGEPRNLLDSFLIDGYGNGSNVDMVINSPSCSIPTMRYVEEMANNNERLTLSSTSSDQNGESFDDKQVKTFFEQFDGNTKRQVKYADFNWLEEELNKGEHGVLPSFLTPTAMKITKAYGDITEHSTLSNCAAYPTHIMLYATVKEMDELKDFKDVSVAKLKVWRDAIIDAQQIKFNVQFAKLHVAKIARAYFGLKAFGPKLYDQKKRLEVELDQITKMLRLREECQTEATYFNDKPLNTGLYPT